MCRFKSGIILKNKVVLAPEENDSHSDLLESLNITDNYENASRVFVRAELVPKDNNKASDVSQWEYIVDQDVVPEWYETDPKRYEQEFRDAVKDWIKDRFTVICGCAWNKIKKDEKGTYYLLNGILENSTFGSDNNYANSKIRKNLNKSTLAEDLKKEFGDKLVPIATDLTSLDGLNDYGCVDGDILAIPTIDLYRECRKNIPKADSLWWLSTPDSTPSGAGADCALYVYSGGLVGCDGCGWRGGGVRPFFILQS